MVLNGKVLIRVMILLYLASKSKYFWFKATNWVELFEIAKSVLVWILFIAVICIKVVFNCDLMESKDTTIELTAKFDCSIVLLAFVSANERESVLSNKSLLLIVTAFLKESIWYCNWEILLFKEAISLLSFTHTILLLQDIANIIIKINPICFI